VGLVCRHRTRAPRPSSALPRRLDHERLAERVRPLDGSQQQMIGAIEQISIVRVGEETQ